MEIRKVTEATQQMLVGAKWTRVKRVLKLGSMLKTKVLKYQMMNGKSNHQLRSFKLRFLESYDKQIALLMKIQTSLLRKLSATMDQMMNKIMITMETVAMVRANTQEMLARTELVKLK